MRAITLHQPWAQLVALGVKTVETRSWAPPKSAIGQQLAIHASQTQKPLDYLCWLEDHSGEPEPALVPLAGRIQIEYRRGFVRAVHNLPLGKVVATCVLADAAPMVSACEEGAIRTLDIHDDGSLWIVEAQTDEEAEDGPPECWDVSDQAAFGDFSPGRWAWLLDDITPMEPPIPAIGRQRMWDLGELEKGVR